MTLYSLENLLIVCSLLVAILVMIESTLLERNGGKLLIGNGFFMIISLTTSVWSLVSCVAWYFLDFYGLGLAVVASYPLYALLGLVYSMHLMRGTDVDDPADVALPAQYLSFCKSFGLVYAVLCACALAQVMGWLKV
ncbi:hypothetical protein [Moraxella marmotae]